MTITLHFGIVLVLLTVTTATFTVVSAEVTNNDGNDCPKLPFSKDVNDPRKYIVNDGSSSYPLYCDENEVFVEELQQCLIEKHPKCNSNEIHLLKSDDSCMKADLCYMGKLLPKRNCPPDMAYDIPSQKCTKEAYSQCLSSTTTSTITTSQLQTTQAKCTGPMTRPNPTDCSKYFECVAGVVVEQTCAPGSLFDKESLKCFPSSMVQCTEVTTTTLPTTTEEVKCTGPMVKPNPTDCSKYFECVAGVQKERTCPPESLFDKENLMCYPSFMAQCAGEVTTKPPTPSTTTQKKVKCTGPNTRPNPTDCSKYFQCVAGEEIEHSCPPGSLFDKEMLMCYPDFMAQCAGQVTTTVPVPTTAPKVSCSDSTPTPNRKDCSKYYTCEAGELKEQKCPPDTLFDLEYRFCYPSFMANCAGQRRRKRMANFPNRKDIICLGELPVKVAHPHDESTYFFCSRNHKVKRLHCGTNRVFDPHSKTCRSI